jgi:hypothetical protein
MKKLFKKIFLRNVIKSFFYDDHALPIINKKINTDHFVSLDFFKVNNNKYRERSYIIRRSPGAGLFSNFIYVLNHLKIADNLKMKPFVNMKDFTTIYNEKEKVNNTFNAWNYFFKNKLNRTNKKYNKKIFILTKNNFCKNFTHNVSSDNFRKLFHKYFIIDPIITKEATAYAKKNLDNNTLGLHYRGTSYKISANHPYPATKTQLSQELKRLIKKYKIKKIFLCTEDLNMFEFIKKKFYKKIIFTHSYRSYWDNAFRKYPRKLHRYLLGKEILIDSIILSKCKYILHTKTNVSEFVKFLDNKKKIKYFDLDNGMSSSNEYFARWLWYYKNIAPQIMGGFSSQLNK